MPQHRPRLRTDRRAGRARKSSAMCRSQCDDVTLRQGRGIMAFREERALIGSAGGFGNRPKHALGEGLEAPLTGRLTKGWSGHDP